MPDRLPLGRPLTQHTYQMPGWFPEEEAFFNLLQRNVQRAQGSARHGGKIDGAFAFYYLPEAGATPDPQD